MPQRKESLPAVTAAAVVAIIFGLLGVSFGALVEVSLLVFPSIQPQQGQQAMPPGAVAISQVLWLFLIAISVFGIFVGAGVIRRRNWARISILIWACFMTLTCALAIPAMFFLFSMMPSMMPGDANIGPVMSVIKWVSVLFYSVPLAVGIWWLVLFTRTRVAIAFTGPATPAPALDASGFPLPETPVLTQRQMKPTCPLPLAILSWFFIASAFSTILFLFMPLPYSYPFYFFGHTFHGIEVKIFIAAFALVNGILGIAILKLKSWALHTTITLQCIFLVNGFISIISPTFLSEVHETMATMSYQHSSFPGGNFIFPANYFRVMMIFGLVLGATILGILLFYRGRFLEQAAAAHEGV